MTVINFLLQSTLIIGHLQSSSLEFFHGDYKPDNVFVKKSTPAQTRYFKFNIFGKEMNTNSSCNVRTLMNLSIKLYRL